MASDSSIDSLRTGSSNVLEVEDFLAFSKFLSAWCSAQTNNKSPN